MTSSRTSNLRNRRMRQKWHPSNASRTPATSTHPRCSLWTDPAKEKHDKAFTFFCVRPVQDFDEPSQRRPIFSARTPKTMGCHGKQHVHICQRLLYTVIPTSSADCGGGGCGSGSTMTSTSLLLFPMHRPSSTKQTKAAPKKAPPTMKTVSLYALLEELPPPVPSSS